MDARHTMNPNEMKIKAEIEELIRTNYKSTHVVFCVVEGEDVCLIDGQLRIDKYPFIAKRILAKYPELSHVYFTGGWTTSVYTRNTLKYLGL